ncbi:MAG: hypothetical protein IJU03_01015 [Thermoguttaceae bacterium]|nr:hypothetical protein [Thermoguttaceae bacterium]
MKIRISAFEVVAAIGLTVVALYALHKGDTDAFAKVGVGVSALFLYHYLWGD